MALKGFLASGFQKLIGASRIKGSNDQWLGEYNTVTTTATTFPLSITPSFGLNVIEWAPTSGVIYNGTQLLSSNPTTPVVLTIRNTSGSNNPISMTNISLATGGIRLNSDALLYQNDSITVMWSSGSNYFEEVSRTIKSPQVKQITVSGSTLSQTDVGNATCLLLTATSARTITAINAGNHKTGQILIVMGVSGSSPITLEQDLSSPYTLVMNGDLLLTPLTTITFVVNDTNNLIELCRSSVGGYS